METNQVMHDLMQTRPLPVAQGGPGLLSLPPEVVGVCFKQAGKVLDGMATCKALNHGLPNDVPGLRLQPKDAELLLSRDKGFTCSNVVSGMRRFRLTPGLEWRLVHRRSTFERARHKDLEEKFPGAGWVTVTGDNGWMTGARVGRICSFEIGWHVREALEIERAFNTVALGMNSTLGQGVLSTMASLTIGVPCNVNNIITAVSACSQTLKSIELHGDCALHPPEIVNVGLALRQCANLNSFSLNSINPKGWDSMSTTPNNAHGAAVVHCTSQIIKSCPLLTEIKLVLCNICDVSAATLATALRDGDTIIDLDICCNEISDHGFRPLFSHGVISRFRSFTGFRPETDAGLHFLIDALPRATNLQRLELTVCEGISEDVEEKVQSKCQKLGIHVTVVTM